MNNDEVVVQAPPSAKRCDHCGAPLRFGRTINGKAMPLDWHPNRDGNVVMVGRTRVVVVTKRMVEGLDPTPAGQRYMPHQATCTALPRQGTLPANVVDITERRKDLR